MVVTADTQTYNEAIIENYKQLLKFAQGDSDNLHNCYLKVVNKVSGFTAHTITEIKTKLVIYTKTAIFNTFKTEKRLAKTQIEIEDCLNQLEAILQNEENLNEDNRSEAQQLEYVSQKLFEYLKLNYDEASQYLFTCYYLYDKDKKLTYAELSTISGFSISKVCGILQRIKADLRKNLIQYINGR